MLPLPGVISPCTCMPRARRWGTPLATNTGPLALRLRGNVSWHRCLGVERNRSLFAKSGSVPYYFILFFYYSFILSLRALRASAVRL